MQAIRIDTTVNSALAALLPDLRRLEGQQVELIVLASNDVDPIVSVQTPPPNPLPINGEGER